MVERYNDIVSSVVGKFKIQQKVVLVDEMLTGAKIKKMRKG